MAKNNSDNTNTRGSRAQEGKSAGGGGKCVALLFWLLFLLVMICLFWLFWPRIQETIAAVAGTQAVSSDGGARTTEEPAAGEEVPVALVPGIPEGTAALPADSDAAPDAGGQNVPEPEPAGQATQTQTQTAVGVQQSPPPVAPPAAEERRNRTLYFIRVDSAGVLIRMPVTRSLPVSDSPLADVLRELLRGPTGEESGQGLITLIPQGTQLISATMRGSTVVLNFSGEFQINRYGAEGFAGQLRQVVWTATEFSTVSAVQILIDGNTVSYLGENIPISGPVGRDSL
jgi:spore germination protein GerM